MNVTTDELPFLVVHGSHVWKAIVVASVALVLGAIWLVRWRRARKITRTTLASVERANGDVVRGTLRGTGTGTLAATLRARKDRFAEPMVASWRTGEIWVETEDGRVALDGEIRVVAGSRAETSHNGVPAAVGEAHLEAARADAPWVHRVRSFPNSEVWTASWDAIERGDRVVVSGCLARTPGAEPSGYREADVAWVLRPPEGRPMELAACAPRTALLRLARDTAAVAIIGIALLSLGVLHVIGKGRLESCQDQLSSVRTSVDEPLEVSNTHACALAAAMPGSRETAVYKLLLILERDPYRDERSMRRLLGASAMNDEECSAVTRRMLKHAMLEDAARHAHACGEHKLEYEALSAQGRFEAAADVQLPPDPEAIARLFSRAPTLIAAGRWAEAARAVDERAAAILAEREDYSQSAARGYRCLAEMLRAFGGDREAPRRLRALEAEEPGRCTPMVAELAPPDERRRLLVESKAFSGTLGDMRLAAGLADQDSWSMDSAAELLARPDRGGQSAAMAWLVASERAAWPEISPPYRAGLLRWIAVGQVFDGQLDAAMATAREAEALPRERLARNDTFVPMTSVVALYTPATNLPLELESLSDYHRETAEMYFWRLLLRNGLRMSEDRYRYMSREPYEAAMGGRGEPLAAALVDRQWHEADLIALLPRLRTGREAVARQVAWHTSQYYEDSSRWLFDLAVHAAMRRELLKLAGNAEASARWGEIYRRFDAVFEDRRRLIALMLWGL